MAQDNSHPLDAAYALYRRGRYDEALAEIARAQTGRPENADTLYLESVCLHGAGRINEALERCKRLGQVFNDPRVPSLQARIGVELPPEAYAAEAAAVAELGFRAYKMRLALGPEKDIEALRRIDGLFGVITGKALYEGRLDLEQAIARCRA